MQKPVFFLRNTSMIFFAVGLFFSFSSFVPSSTLTGDILDHTNLFRKSKGKSALVMKEYLNTIARRHSQDMANGRVSFGHGGFKERQRQVHRILGTATMAENVAYGPSTGKEVVRMWQKSSGHRSNMLGNYKYTGIGTAKDSRGRIYFTQIFVR